MFIKFVINREKHFCILQLIVTNSIDPTSHSAGSAACYVTCITLCLGDEGCEACRLHQLSKSALEPGEILDCSHSPTSLSLATEPSPFKGQHQNEPYSEQMTSTPSRPIKQTNGAEYCVQAGSYSGHVQHKDSSLLGAVRLVVHVLLLRLK